MTRRFPPFQRVDPPLRGIPRQHGGRRVTPIRPPAFQRPGWNSGVARVQAQLMRAHDDIDLAIQAFRNARPGAQKSACWRRVLGLRMWMYELRELRAELLDDSILQWQDEEDRARQPGDLRVRPPGLSDSNW